MAIITLLTDFGIQDEYVGVLKGVILSTDPKATIVDVSHGIPPQDVAGAAYMLKSAISYFPRGTIHVAVVDPGVGTKRSIIAALCQGHLFMAPDNGLLEPVLRSGGDADIHRVENEALFRHPVSRTFHGRDIFAPVAGHLSKGLSLNAVGPGVSVDDIIPLDEWGPQHDSTGEFVGKIVVVDSFGNLITNIHASDLSALDYGLLLITVGETTIRGLAESYAQTSTSDPMAILGSRDCVEIAINLGSAAKALKAGVGDTVRVAMLSSA